MKKFLFSLFIAFTSQAYAWDYAKLDLETRSFTLQDGQNAALHFFSDVKCNAHNEPTSLIYHGYQTARGTRNGDENRSLSGKNVARITAQSDDALPALRDFCQRIVRYQNTRSQALR